MDASNGRLRLMRGIDRMRKIFSDTINLPEAYPIRRRVFNQQRMQRHPTSMSASRRRKLRRT